MLNATFADFGTLMRLTSNLGKAKKLAGINGNFESVAMAQKEHDEYVELIYNSDGMMNIGELKC